MMYTVYLLLHVEGLEEDIGYLNAKTLFSILEILLDKKSVGVMHERMRCVFIDLWEELFGLIHTGKYIHY